MEKRIVIVGTSWILLIIAFLSLSHTAKAQCTPGFLGNDRPLVLCSAVANIDYSNLFQTQASFEATPMLPATDTIQRPGLPDTIIFHQVKLRVVATLPNGCKDTAVVRIPFNVDPFPNLGADKSVKICRGQTTDLTPLYNPAPFSANWSTSTPALAEKGTYQIWIVTKDGCSDTANITVEEFPYKSMGNDTILPTNSSQQANLFTALDTTGWQVTWNTSNATAAPPGLYWAIGLDKNNCYDTTLVEVCKKPKLGSDTTVKLCPGNTLSLYGVYNLQGLSASFEVATPTAVGLGQYRIIVTNQCGAKDTAMINVVPAIKPNFGPDLPLEVCANETTNLEILYSFTNVTARWSIPDATQAPPGIHRLIVENTDQCRDTVFIEVTPIDPYSWANDTTVTVCGGQKKDLTSIYPFPEEAFVEWVNVPDPKNAGPGTYTVTIDNGECFYTLKVEVLNGALDNSSIEVCTFDMATTGIFTTNAFRSVVVDKQGVVWAGADGTGSSGGLYRFTRTGPACNQGQWSASNRFPNSTYRDLHVSPINGDNRLWSASNGHSQVQAITGGVYRIADLFNVQRFGSKLDADGTLSSRFANGLAIAPNGKLYVALTVSQTAAGVIGEGDVYETDLTLAEQVFSRTNLTPANVGERRVSAVGIRNEELWAAFQRSCINSVCIDPYIQRWNTATGTSAGTITEANSPIPFTSSSSTIVRAIITAKDGRTYVGLSGGKGFAVMEPTVEGQNSAWTLCNDQNSAFPKDAVVNFNAITEVNGEIWIGTNKGLLVYDGAGPLTECSSYSLYDTSNGLPTMNITDIAYDTARLEVWLAHDKGVSRVGKIFNIGARVVNVFVGKFPADLQPRLFTRPIKGARAVLFNAAGTRLDSLETNDNGEFNLSKFDGSENYRVEVSYKHFKYRYEQVKPNAFMGAIMMPDSLINDIDSLRKELTSKTVNLVLPEIEKALPWPAPTYQVDLFDTSKYGAAYAPFKQLLAADHQKQVENLAQYYLDLVTIHEIGLLSNRLAEKAVSGAVEVVTAVTELAGSLKSLQKFKKLWKTAGTNLDNTPTVKKQFIKEVGDLIDEGIEEAFDMVKEKIDEMLAENIRDAKDEFGEPLLDSNGKAIYDIVKKAVDMSIDHAKDLVENKKTAEEEDDGEEEENEDIAALKEALVKAVVKNLENAVGALYHKYYARTKHKQLILKLGQKAAEATSGSTYALAYQKVYDKGFFTDNGTNSLLRQAIDETEEAEDAIEILSDLSESTKTMAELTSTASKLALSTVLLAEAAPVLRTISLVLEGSNLALFKGPSMVLAVSSAFKVGNFSDDVITKTGFPSIQKRQVLSGPSCSSISLLALEQAQRQYQQALNAYRVYVRGSFDTAVEFSRRVRSLNAAAELYEQQLQQVIGQLLARHTASINTVAGSAAAFRQSLQQTVSTQRNVRFAFELNNLGYILSPQKTAAANTLDSSITGLIAQNFAAVDAVRQVAQLINNNCVSSPPYLSKTDFQIATSYRAGDTGRLQYRFTNHGTQAFSQLRFKATAPDDGFSFIGSDSLLAGTLAPGASVDFVLRYQAPNRAASSSFSIVVQAANGIYSNEPGTLVSILASTPDSIAFTIQAGNWSNPAVWNTGRVPGTTTAVSIRHNIVIDTDANVRSINAESPAQVQVAPGRRIRLAQQRP